MPIYEFYCSECHTVFNFYSSRINTEKIPDCPKCSKILSRQLSTFATIGKAQENDFDFNFDESKLEHALSGLAGEAENIDESDPRQLAALMKKFSTKTGLNLGDGMEEAIARLEAGEDPDTIEKELGDALEPDDFLKQKTKRKKKDSPPLHDDTLYDL